MYKKSERSNSAKRSESEKSNQAKSSDSAVGHESKTASASTCTHGNKATVGVQTEPEAEESFLPDLLESIVASSPKDQVATLQYSPTSKQIEVTKENKKVCLHMFQRKRRLIEFFHNELLNGYLYHPALSELWPVHAEHWHCC